MGCERARGLPRWVASEPEGYPDGLRASPRATQMGGERARRLPRWVASEPEGYPEGLAETGEGVNSPVNRKQAGGQTGKHLGGHQPRNLTHERREQPASGVQEELLPAFLQVSQVPWTRSAGILDPAEDNF